MTIFEKGRVFLCLIVAPISILLPVINRFPFPSSASQYSDIIISHFPNAYYWVESLSQWKMIPLWSPTILSGYPFVANPLSGIWYLPNWLVVILPIPIAFNLLILCHLILGGLGVYQLLKGEGLTEIAALFGGLAFECMPKLFAHYGAGHISLIMAVCWTPWLIVLAQRFWNNESGSHGKRRLFIIRIVFPALVLSSIVVADIRWIGFASLLWMSYLIFKGGFRKSKTELEENSPGAKQSKNWKRLFGGIAIPIIIASGLTAPFLLPFFEYVQHPTRYRLTPVDNLVFSLPPAKLLGLIFPAFGDYYEWIVYPGILVLLLAGLSWAITNHSKYKIYWTSVFIVTLLFALGSNLPGSSWWTSLPGISLMRVPSRIIFISGLAIMCLAARGLDGLLQGITIKESRVIRLILVALIGFLLLLNVGAAWITAQFIKNLIWSLVFGTVGAMIIWILISGTLQKIWVSVLVVICIIDWVVVDLSLFFPRPSQVVLNTGKAITNYLKNDDDLFRVYSPSYSLPQQVAAVNHIELADGVDPLQLADYVDFMAAASGVNEQGYSVTLPQFKSGDPASDNRNARPSPELLGMLNVKYVVADYDINVDGLSFVKSCDLTRIYLNQYWLPRAWLQPLESSLGKNITPPATISWSPNFIRISVGDIDKPQRLVLSELSYPGWQVTVDGKRRSIDVMYGLLRSVEIQPGDVNIEFRFQPLSLIWGISVWMMTMIIFVGTWVFYGNRRQQ